MKEEPKMAQVKKGFQVTVRGQYYANAREGARGKVLRNYHITFKLPSSENVLSVVKNKILNRVLPLKYPDYTGFRTHILEEIKALDGSSHEFPLHVRSAEQIAVYVKERGLPVKVDTYDDLIELRQAVLDCEKDPEAFVKRDVKRLADRMLDKEILEMNPDFKEADEPEVIDEDNSEEKVPADSGDLKNEEVTGDDLVGDQPQTSFPNSADEKPGVEDLG